MSKRYFIFLYPEPGPVKSYLDLAIFLLNPNEKWPAHITVAGPFPNKRRFRIQNRVFESTVFALGVGSFLPKTGTVYIHVGFRDQWSVWKKPDFVGNPIPHLTLYDGRDVEFGTRVFSIANKIKPYFSFYTRGLQVVESISGQYRADLRESVDFSLMPELRGAVARDVAEMPVDDRLELFGKALRAASNVRPA